MRSERDLSSILPEVSIDEVQLISKHAPSPQPESPAADEGPAVVYKYREVWQRAFNKIKGKNLLARLGKDIQLYGASTVAHGESDNEVTGDFVKSLLQKTVIVGKKEERFAGLFRPDSKVHMIWSLVYFCLMAYTAFLTPFNLAFSDPDQTDSWYYLDFIINILFACDILITLNTAIEEKGVLETRRLRIFLRYLKSWLVLDIVACIPFSSFDVGNSAEYSGSGQMSSLLRLLRLPRLYRVLRLTRVFKMLNNQHSWHCLDRFQERVGIRHSAMRMIFFMITVLLAVHIMACIWFFLSLLEGHSPQTWAGKLNLQSASTLDQYMASLYWTVTTLSTVGYGDIVPSTSLERIVSIFWMIFGLCFFSFTVSSLSSMLNSVDTKESLLSHKLAAIDEFAEESLLTKDLRERLRVALKYSTLKSGFSSQMKHEIFSELPRELRCEVALAMHHGAARHIPFFRERDQAFLAAVVPFLNSLEIKDHCPVYKAGEYSDEVYFIAKGKCLHMYGDLVMKKLEEGSYFGEIEVLLGIPRKNAVLAASTTDLLSMGKKLMNMIEGEFPPVFEEMRQIAEIRSKANDRMMVKFKNLFGERTALAGRFSPLSPTSPVSASISARTPSVLITQPQESELPLLSAKEAHKRSEERLLSLEYSIAALKAQIDLLVRVLVKTDAKVSHGEDLETSSYH
jgi:CRP-like cAMP-binding protein